MINNTNVKDGVRGRYADIVISLPNELIKLTIKYCSETLRDDKKKSKNHLY